MYQEHEMEVIKFIETSEFVYAGGSGTCETEGDNEAAFNAIFGDC